MRPIIAFLIVATLAACQVTTSQSMGSGVTIRNDVSIGDEQATTDRTTDERDAEGMDERRPELTIGGGFGTGVSR